MSYPTGSSNVPASEHYNGTVGYNSLVHHLHKALDEIEDFCAPLVELSLRLARSATWRHHAKIVAALAA